MDSVQTQMGKRGIQVFHMNASIHMNESINDNYARLQTELNENPFDIMCYIEL